MILIDNYDSFTYNIVEYFRILDKHIQVIKNDEMTIEDFDKLNFNSIILSPGPSNPSNAGITMDIIKKYHKEKAILGVCLGYQAIAEFFGANIVEAKKPPIIPIAHTKDNILMGIKIKDLPIYGVQFHPEAILTKNGINIFKNFIDICGIL